MRYPKALIDEIASTPVSEVQERLEKLTGVEPQSESQRIRMTKILRIQRTEFIVRKWLRERGMTQRDFAARLGYPKHYSISAILSNEDNLAKIERLPGWGAL